MSVKVGVRVRPFNKRQLQLQCRRCVQMQGKTTRLVEADGTVKNFVYDYSFWSHDKFMVNEDGINVPVDDKYADQMRVYNEIGSDILVNAWRQGYNCCLFAYGQTGSGKSYSMIGYGANRGIIPIVCDQIFKKIANNKQPATKSFQVMISMMEIYNETVRDLLQKNKKKQLKICESKKLGVYVQGLYKHAVYSYEQIAKKIEQGSNNRSIAATLMNESSSRSHTIVSINFVQKIQVSPSQTSIKYSCIHLVDLAGSQCVAKTGVDSKDRLRETAKINQSLSTLGRVIEILAENASKTEKQFVPYRDSKLTFILRNALGGNSRTAMICAISPADDNLQQTLSTLRYASRAKKIQNKAIVNQSDVDKLIRMLRQQNQYLKKMLQQAKFTKTVINHQVISNYNRMSQNMAEFGIIGAQSESFLEEIGEIQGGEGNNKSVITEETEEEEEQVRGKLLENNQDKLELPYITNISQDQLLSFRVKYNCQDLMIGNKNGTPKPDVVLAALGIQPHHARIYIDGQQNGVKRVFLQVLAEEAQDYTYVNGQNISCKEKKQLFDNDRLIFGTGCIFLVVVFGGKQRTQTLIKIEDIDYQFAIKEMQNINLDRSMVIRESEQELRKKIVLEVQKEFQDIKKTNEENMRRQIQLQEQQYQQRIKQMQIKQIEQAEKLKQQLQRKQREAQKLQDQKKRVREQIQKYRSMQKQMQHKLLQKLQAQKMRQKQILQQKQKQQQHTKQRQAQQQLQRTNLILLQRMQKITILQKQISAINKQNEQKQLQIKQQIQKQQQLVQKELEIKTIMCQNENIITEYRLELGKKTKNARQLRQLLVKKQKGFLQKQLTELVPMIQQFNLMGKQMHRRVQAGLSIQYKYISESQIIQALKNNTYKSKLKILIHVINKEQGRGYYWSTEVFRNRFEHARDAMEMFISKNYQKERLTVGLRDKSSDPYWQPEAFEVYGLGYLSLQCLLYQFSYTGPVTIVSQGHCLGQMQVSLTPLTLHAGTFIKQQQDTQQLRIFNPRDLIQRSLSFQLQLKHITLNSDLNIQKIRIQYQLLQSNYKVKKYQTDDVMFSQLHQYVYTRQHTISDISENTILHYTDRPVCFMVSAVIKLTDQDQLTNRDSFYQSKISSFVGNNKSSFATEQSSVELSPAHQQTLKNLGVVKISSFTDIKPSAEMKTQLHPTVVPSPSKPDMSKKTGAIVENVEIMSKIENDYLKKRKQTAQIPQQHNHHRGELTRSFGGGDDKKKKKKDENCSIY